MLCRNLPKQDITRLKTRSQHPAEACPKRQLFEAGIGAAKKCPAEAALLNKSAVAPGGTALGQSAECYTLIAGYLGASLPIANPGCGWQREWLL